MEVPSLKCVRMFNHNREGEVMNNVTTVGIDLAKNVFSLHGVDESDKTLMRKTVSRAKLAAVFSVRSQRATDGNDVEAICEAVSRPYMLFVPVKSIEQQALLTLHRVRLGFIEERTATINRVRGLLMEFGAVLPQREIEAHAQRDERAQRIPALSGVGPVTASGVSPRRAIRICARS